MTLSITRGGSATSTTAGTTLTVTPGAAAVNTAVILLIACDNSGTSGVAPTISISTNVIDSWRQVGTTLRNPSSTTNTGVAGFAYQGNVTRALTGSETVTITFGSTTTAKAALCWITSASVTDNQSRVFGTTAASGSATSANSGSATVVANHIAIGFVAWETNLTVTGDSDANGGATWSTLTPVVANTGTDTSSISLIAQWKLPTSAVAQALNPAISTARNYAGLLVDVQEIQRATGTATPAAASATAAATATVSAGTITGTVARTNSNDTASATGSVTWPTITGTVAKTNSNDAASATGSVTWPTITGTSSTTNANDTGSATGSAVSGTVTGTSSTTNANDTVTATAPFEPGGSSNGGPVGFVQPLSPSPAIVGASATTNRPDRTSATGSSVDQFDAIVAQLDAHTFRITTAITATVTDWAHVVRDDEDILLLI